MARTCSSRPRWPGDFAHAHVAVSTLASRPVPADPAAVRDRHRRFNRARRRRAGGGDVRRAARDQVDLDRIRVARSRRSTTGRPDGHLDVAPGHEMTTIPLSSDRWGSRAASCLASCSPAGSSSRGSTCSRRSSMSATPSSADSSCGAGRGTASAGSSSCLPSGLLERPRRRISTLRRSRAAMPRGASSSRSWVASWVGYATFSAFVALMILFPSGRLPAGRWHRPAIALLATCLGLTALSAVAPFVSFNPTGGVATVAVPNRFAVLPDLGIWALLPLDALILPIVGCLAIGVASMLVRYRRADRRRASPAPLARRGDSVHRARGCRRARLDRHRRPRHRRPRLDRGNRGLPDDARGDLHRDHALPAVRDRPDRQPDDRVGGGDRGPRGGVRGARRGASGGAGAGDEREHARGRGIDARRRRPVPAGATPGSASGGSAVRPRAV